MSLVTVIDLCLSFPGKDLFKNIGFQVESGDRIGLVGPNGSGKTSLLRLLAGESPPDRGEIRITSGARIGYLPQDIGETLSGPLLQSVTDSIPGRVPIRKEIERIKQALKQDLEPWEQERLAVRLAEAHHEEISLDMRFPAHRAEKILEGLGFQSVDFFMPVSSLSGGWQVRASLGSILFQEPDLLLLDEPTNYLDIPSVHWLEQFLRDYKGAIILVCHDRDFLNRQIQRVISFEPEGMKTYKGNYDKYLKAREEEIKGLEARAKNQEQKIKEAKRFIERFRAKATKARQAQSKIKLLKKVELVESRRKEKSIRFSFPKVPAGGRVVVTIKGLSKSFEKKLLYRDIDLAIFRGERIALIGPNGFGKTTMLRMIAGEINPDQGVISLGHNVNMSYYAQHHSEMLDPNKTVIEEVYQIVPHESVSFVRGVCGSFLFSGDDVDKPIKVLSGGEKARVSLAKILIKPGNLLVMDEPTNHLDLISSEILIDALADFNGTLLFVSHNQSFVNRLATKIWDIRDSKIIEYPGGLYEYYDHLTNLDKDSYELASKEAEEGMNREDTRQGKIRDSKKERRKKNAENRTLISSTLKPVLDKLSLLEDRISDLERREREISGLLADPGLFKDKGRSIPLLNEYGRLREEMEKTMLEWEEEQGRLEEMKEELGLSD
jgi:ATP-binding cassette subfamily F protein 3